MMILFICVVVFVFGAIFGAAVATYNLKEKPIAPKQEPKSELAFEDLKKLLVNLNYEQADQLSNILINMINSYRKQVKTTWSRDSGGGLVTNWLDSDSQL